MTPTSMVAQLTAGPDSEPSLSKGSAWFIDEQYALTALHCVQSEDGCFYKNIFLNFHKSKEKIAVEIAKAEKTLDVALLKITNTSDTTASSIPIFPLARNSGGRHDKVLMLGHPAISLTSSPDGVSVGGTIHELRHPFKGAKGQLDCEVIQCNYITVSGLNGQSGLQGISGGPVILDLNNTKAAVIGLVIEDGLNGSHIHVIPIAAIAEKILEVKTALENSTHVNVHDRRICLSLATVGATLEWSAGISPTNIGQLWHDSNLRKYELHSNVKLSQLGAAAKALTRLAIHSGVKSIHAPDTEAWASRIYGAYKISKYSHLEIKPVAALGTLPAKAQNFTIDMLANDIHTALNNELLALLNDKLFACLDGNEPCGLGCEIEQQLRGVMWTTWQTWQSSISNNAALLTSFLTRVFSLNADEPLTDEALLAIGLCDGVNRRLLHATIYVLAIAAAGISTQPHVHAFGNFAVNNKTGHSSGVEFQDSKRISMVAASHDWKTDVIFLPFLQSQLLVDVSKAVALTKPDGTLGRPQKYKYPIAVTADNEFLTALEMGANAVLAYYNDRVAEVQFQKNAMSSPTRTEALDA